MNYTHQEFIDRLTSGKSLLPDTPDNVELVVAILDSYGVVIGEYYRNLLYMADTQFLKLFPFFKYFNGEFSIGKLFKHWSHDRINFEYAEYCMRTMLWHGGGKFDEYMDSPEFIELANLAIAAKIKGNFIVQGLNLIGSEFCLEQVRMFCYTSALGQFWDVMSEMFLALAERHRRGEIKSIPDIVQHILDGLVAAAAKPISYAVKIGDKSYDLIPKSAGITFLMDVAVPYVEAIFFRGTPFLGTVSYNAQAQQIDPDNTRFQYGALYADPLPIGGSGIPPTLLMQDMRHFLPEYLRKSYEKTPRGEDDLRVLICQAFQKSMFCVTNAAIVGLSPHPITTQDPQEREAVLKYINGWLDRLMLNSRLITVNQ
jgi:CO2 hydration protein